MRCSDSANRQTIEESEPAIVDKDNIFRKLHCRVENGNGTTRDHETREQQSTYSADALELCLRITFESNSSLTTTVEKPPSHTILTHLSLDKMAQDPREYMQRLQRALQQRQSAGFGGGMPSGGAAGRGLFGLIALGVGVTILSNSIFNVDGGHRAIKYTRIGE